MGSVLLHAGLIAATFFSISHTLEISDQSPPVIPVDLVTIGEKTNIAPTVQRDVKYHAVAVTQPPPAPMDMKTPVVPQPQEQAEAAPPEQAPSEPLVKSVPTPPKPLLKPKDQPKPDQDKKKAADQFAALLNKLTSQSSAPANARVSDRTHKGVGAQNAMTMDLVDALRNQIAQCWNVPAGAPHPEQLIVTLRVFLNPDGSVAQPPQLTGNSAAEGNPYMQAAADAAKRAIFVCAPYKLPADRYSLWRDIEVTFDPRQMLGAN